MLMHLLGRGIACERCGSGHGDRCGFTMIDRCKLRSVGACLLYMSGLFCCSLYMVFPLCSLLLGTRPRVGALRSAIVTCPVIDYRCVIDDNGFVNISIMDDCGVYIGYRCVIKKGISFPPAAPVTGTPISITIIHAAVKANVTAPVTGMKSVNTTRKTPVSRGPQVTILRWPDPYTGNPEISIVCISPDDGYFWVQIGRAHV